MPELPEVETVRRGLEPVLVGRRLVRVEQRRPDLRFAFPDGFTERLTGRAVLQLSRRAKYLTASIEGGEVLVMHLGMSGQFLVSHPSPRPSRGEGKGEGQQQTAARVSAPHPNPLPASTGRGDKLGVYVHETGRNLTHDHVVFHTDDGTTVTFNDPRRFGFMLLVPEREIAAHPLFKSLGPEPLGNELNASYLAARASGRRSDLKAFLMDQRTVAGLGNIYVCEALHRARLSPRRRTSKLAKANGTATDGAENLVTAIRAVLNDALAAGGSSLRDYRKADGTLGDFQHSFRVYDREGEPCPRKGCGGTVRRIVQGARSTFYCPTCQR